MFLSTLREAWLLLTSGDPDLWRIVWLSLWVSGTAVTLAGLLGVPVGAWIGLRALPGEQWLTAVIYTGMGFPPVLIGLVVYLLLSRHGALGGLDALFTPSAMVLAQTILALPLVVGVTLTAVRGVGRDLPQQLRTLGATEWQIIATILREARYGVVVGLVAGFGAAISEVGAVMLVGGNIEGHTRVLTTAIVLETRQGRFEVALALGGVLLALTFLTNVLAIRWQTERL